MQNKRHFLQSVALLFNPRETKEARCALMGGRALAAGKHDGQLEY
jgi:hypothetical protein